MAQHPLIGRKKTRTHKDRIRQAQLARYARIRAALGVQSLTEIQPEGDRG
jgi:hypothetical protein